jgi:hypothetical protein
LIHSPEAAISVAEKNRHGADKRDEIAMPAGLDLEETKAALRVVDVMCSN